MRLHQSKDIRHLNNVLWYTILHHSAPWFLRIQYCMRPDETMKPLVRKLTVSENKTIHKYTIPPVSQNKTHVSNVQPWIMKHGRTIIYLNMVRFKMMVSFRTQWYSSEEVLSCFFVVHGHWSLRLVTGPGIQVRKPRTYTTASYPNQMSGTCWNNSNRRDPQWTWTSSTPPQHQSLLENCTINPARSLPVQRCSLEDRMGFALKIQGFHVTCRSWFAWQCDHNFS